MYQYRVRPRPGHERAVNPASEQQCGSIIRSVSPRTTSRLLLSLPDIRFVHHGAMAVLVGCLISVLSGCGGVSFNSNSQKSSAGTQAELTMISCGVQSLTGAQTTNCSVYLSGSATNSTSVALTSSNTALKVPALVVVQAGEKTAQFSAVTEAVTKSMNVTITGKAEGVIETDVITLNPVSDPTSTSAPTLKNISCGTQSLSGPAILACSVSLSAAATGETPVTVSSSSSALKAPASVNVASGKTSAAFNVTALAVSTTQKISLTAKADGVTKADSIILYPAFTPPPASTAALSKVSCGAQTLTGPITQSCAVYLSAAAKSQTTVLLSSSNSALRVPASVNVAANKTSANFSVAAIAVSTLQRATLTATAGGVRQTDVITLSPVTTAPPPVASLTSISCGTQSLTGAQTKTCSVSLSAAATSQTLVKLSSSISSLQTPSSATISKGATSATFNVTALAVKTSQKATLTATAGGVTHTDVITLYPALASVPTLSKISCGTQTLIGPTTEACSIYLTAAAISPTVVTLSSSKSALQVPVSVTISAGSTSVSFSAKASTVTTAVSVTLTATSNGISLTDVLRLEGASASQPATTPPSVQLNWDAPGSTSDPIAGYHVYRAIGSGSNYSMLSSLDALTTYTDSTVQSGSTYEYIVKSVDTQGVESAPSNPTSVTIP